VTKEFALAIQKAKERHAASQTYECKDDKPANPGGSEDDFFF